MFIISLTYTCTLSEIDKFLEEHITYLDKQYKLGHFIASGPKVPRNGGVILSQMESRDNLEDILDKDPFKINNLAKYEIQEFIPNRSLEGFDNLKEINN